MEAIAVGSKIFGAIQQMQMAKAQQQMYNMQAKQAEMQARAGMLRTRSETLNHKRQGIQVLKKIAQNLSTINARAAAGSVDRCTSCLHLGSSGIHTDPIPALTQVGLVEASTAGRSTAPGTVCTADRASIRSAVA